MTVKSLLQEYSIELSDVRWYLSQKTAERLLTYKDDLHGLARLIWSGRLEADLYNMDEVFLEDLQDRMDRSLIDEVRVRELLGEITAAKARR